MFGGDTILNEISPNVGLWGEGESKDPLAEFAHSLERIRDEFQPRIIYPGHRTPIEDAAGRVNELLAHHEERLGECVTGSPAARRRRTSWRSHLWGSRLDYHQRRFAMVEAAAHLVRLVASRTGARGHALPVRRGVSDTTRMLDISGLGVRDAKARDAALAAFGEALLGAARAADTVVRSTAETLVVAARPAPSRPRARRPARRSASC